MPERRVGDALLHYEDDDFADPWTPHDTVVMLHGFGRNGSFWRAWVPYLARWFRVIRVDLRGCGGSEKPGPDYVCDVRTLAGDVRGLVDGLGLGRVFLIGESGGGVVAAWSAGTWPDRYRGVVLVSTPLRLGRHDTPQRAAGFPSVREGLLSVGMREWWLRSRGAPPVEPLERAREEHMASEFARTPLHVGLAMWDWIDRSGLDLTEQLKAITAPVLLMTPALSLDTSAAEQTRIAELIPHVERRIYPGATHEMYYRMADAIAPDAVAFLRSVAS